MPNPRAKAIPIPFPIRGVHRGFAASAQPAGTCPDALNCRAYGPIDGRVRGGQRQGISKAFTTQLAARVDGIAAVSKPLSATGGDAPEEPVLNEDWETPADEAIVHDLTDFDEYDGVGSASPSVYTDSNTRARVNTYLTAGVLSEYGLNGMRMKGGTVSTSVLRAVLWEAVDAVLAEPYSFAVDIVSFPEAGGNDYGDWDSDGTAISPSLICRVATDLKTCLELRFSLIFDGGAWKWSVRCFEWTSGSSNEVTGTKTLLLDPQTAPQTLKISDNGTTIVCTVDGVEALSVSTAFNAGGTNPTVGFGWTQAGSQAANEIYTDNWVLASPARAPFGRLDTRIVVLGDQKVYKAQLGVDTALTQISGGSDATGLLAGSITTAINYGVNTDNHNGTIGEALAGVYLVFAVDGLNKRVINAFTSTGGEQVFDLDTLALEESGVLDQVTNGAVVAGITPYIVANWRGRLCLSGDTKDPNNLYASRLGFPFDFEFSTLNNNGGLAEAAFALDNADIGRNPDVITALIPFDDDRLIIGGSNSIRMLRGDPAAGGDNIRIANGIGVVGPNAWAEDRKGNIYFMSHDGLYIMNVAGGGVQGISDTVLDDVLRTIDINANFVHLAYDQRNDGVFIFIYPLDGMTNGTHIFYDERQQGFWPDQYTVSIGPTAAASVVSDDPDERFVYLGGSDGYVRQFDSTSKNDDGTAINSYIEYSPQHVGGDIVEGVLIEQHAVMVNGSDGLTWTVRGAKTAENIVDDLPASTITGTLATAGFGRPIRSRLRAAIMQLKLDNSNLSETWSVERWVFHVRAGGRRR